MPCKLSFHRFRRPGLSLLLSGLLGSVVFATEAKAQESIVQLDAAQTEINFTLGADFHTVHGIFKLKSGTIRFDSATGKASGAIVVDAASGNSGNGDRDRNMHGKVLESDKFAEITFEPIELKGALNPKGASHVEVSGRFQLHGQSHDLTLPIDIQANGPQLEFKSHFTVPYIQWGLKNPSNFILRVSDKVTIDVHSVAHFVSP